MSHDPYAGQQPSSQPYAGQPYGDLGAYAQSAAPQYPPGVEPPLDQPWYGIGFLAAIKRALKKYAVFSGRASRGEYWWWALSQVLIFGVLGILGGVLGTITSTDGGQTPGAAGIPFLVLLGLVYLAVLIPNISLTVRRLHDANFSGWLILLALIPSIGGLILLIFTVMPANPAGRRFG